MAQYNTLNVNLSNSKLNQLKSGNKNSTEVTLTISSNTGCMFLSCHVRVPELTQTIYLPECQGTSCLKEARNLKLK